MKILIVQLGRIGDLILLTPVFRAIKTKFPDSEITVLAGKHAANVIENNPRIKLLVWDKSPSKFIPVILKLRKTKFDFLIDVKDHFSREGSLIAQIVKAKTKIGFNLQNKKVYDISIPSDIENKELHFVDRCFNALEPLGIEKPQNTPKPELFPKISSESYVSEFLNDSRFENYITINISASQAKKMWQKEKWIEFIKRISGQQQIVITSAPAERQIALQIAEGIQNVSVFKSRSMHDVISLIENSALLITPDTSLVHVAAAFNIPLIGLFSGLDDFYRKFHPLSDVFYVIKADQGFDGIQTIEPHELFECYKNHF